MMCSCRMCSHGYMVLRRQQPLLPPCSSLHLCIAAQAKLLQVRQQQVWLALQGRRADRWHTETQTGLQETCGHAAAAVWLAQQRREAVQQAGQKVWSSWHFQHTARQPTTLPAPGLTATASKNAGLPRWSCCWQLDFWRRSRCAASTSGVPRPSAASLLRPGTWAGAGGAVRGW